MYSSEPGHVLMHKTNHFIASIKPIIDSYARKGIHIIRIIACSEDLTVADIKDGFDDNIKNHVIVLSTSSEKGASIDLEFMMQDQVLRSVERELLGSNGPGVSKVTAQVQSLQIRRENGFGLIESSSQVCIAILVTII